MLSEAYLAVAADYEHRTQLFPGWRELLVARLAPRHTDTVLDVSCGTGLNFDALRQRVGSGGHIIGIEESPELLAVARRLVTQRRWRNVTLIHASARMAEVPPGADAVLFAMAHDVLQSPGALAHLFTRLRPGARVAAGGWKSPPGRLWPLGCAVSAWCRPWVADFTGFEQPWRLLGEHVNALEVTQLGFGTGYLADGRAHRAS